MLSTGLVAIDSTILATAVPSIVDDLGRFHQFPWLFSVYLLGQAVAVPIYGKVSDIVGRKTIMLFGIVLFLVLTTAIHQVFLAAAVVAVLMVAAVLVMPARTAAKNADQAS